MSSNEEDNETEVLSNLLHGNAQAFENIYRKYVSALFSYTRKNIASLEDCEEIVQEVFVEIWQERERLTFVHDLKGYLFRLLRFRIARYFRREKVKRKYEQHYRLFESLYDNTLVESSEPLNVQAIIEKGLVGLPERCRQAVNLRIHENLSNSEIAARMNIGKISVENYIVMARAHLKKYYSRQPHHS